MISAISIAGLSSTEVGFPGTEITERPTGFGTHEPVAIQLACGTDVVMLGGARTAPEASES